jgi:hypothetical protein
VRREHERAFVTLKLHEIGRFLGKGPKQWRALFAMALFLGLCKGELFALQKEELAEPFTMIVVGGAAIGMAYAPEHSTSDIDLMPHTRSRGPSSSGTRQTSS